MFGSGRDYIGVYRNESGTSYLDGEVALTNLGGVFQRARGDLDFRINGYEGELTFPLTQTEVDGLIALIKEGINLEAEPSIPPELEPEPEPMPEPEPEPQPQPEPEPIPEPEPQPEPEPTPEPEPEPQPEPEPIPEPEPQPEPEPTPEPEPQPEPQPEPTSAEGEIDLSQITVSGYLSHEGDLIVTNKKDQRLDIGMVGFSAGANEITVGAKNFGASLPFGYTAFNVEVYLDGVNAGTISIPASNDTVQFGSLPVTMDVGKTAQLELVWVNDLWLAPGFDANIAYASVNIASITEPEPQPEPEPTPEPEPQPEPEPTPEPEPEPQPEPQPEPTSAEGEIDLSQITVSGYLSHEGDLIVTNKKDQRLDIGMVGFSAGNNEIKVGARNFGAKLPTGYDAFEVEVYLGGVLEGVISIPAHESIVQTGSLIVNFPDGKMAQLELVWVNDLWQAPGVDANIAYASVNIASTYLRITSQIPDFTNQSFLTVSYQAGNELKEKSFTLTEGENDLVIMELDGQGNQITLSFKVTLDTIPPDIQLTSVVSVSTTSSRLTVDYTVDGIAKQKLFSLSEGTNSLNIQETDLAGNTTVYSFQIEYLPPEIPDPGEYPNQFSPLGINLASVTNWSPQIVFNDVFKSAKLVKVSPTETKAVMMIAIDGHFPSGEYTVLYDGEGTIEYLRDPKLVSKEPGREVINVQANKGIELRLHETNPNNPIRNVRVIMPGYEDTYQKQPFYLPFLEKLKNFKTLRFMDLMRTNGNKSFGNVTWANRSKVTDLTQRGEKGVALEYLIDLANALNIDPWFNVHHSATDDYVQGMAQLIKDRLNPNLKATIEYSNEVWNTSFNQSSYATSQGKARGYATGSANARSRFYAQRSAEVFQIFDSVFGASAPDRLIKTMGSNHQNTGDSKQILDWEVEDANGNKTGKKAYEYADTFAVAPYWGHSFSNPTGPITMTLDQFFDALRDEIYGKIQSKTIAQAEIANTRGLRLVAYEGGQHLVAHSNPEAEAFFHAANRDPRMMQLYLEDLLIWKAAGGTQYTSFTFVKPYDRYGSWGILEWMDQDVTTAPKYQALLDFIVNNPNWWE